MKKSFKLKAKVWRWPGDIGWYFVNIDRKISEEIRGVYTKGFVKITATVGKTTWQTSLFPHTKEQAYLLSIKQIVRKKENIWEGSIITISFVLI